MLSYLIYTSTATKRMSLDSLQSLGSLSASINANENITGLLLYDSMQFMQVLEGERDIIQQRFDKIKMDNRHTNVKLLMIDNIQERNFSEWSMKVKDISSGSSDESILLPNKSDNPSAYISLIYRLLSNILNQEFKALKVHQSSLEHHETELNFKNLTKREKQVLALIVKGYTAIKAASILHISEKTAARHTENICMKLKCRTKSELIMKVFSSGYISELLNN